MMQVAHRYQILVFLVDNFYYQKNLLAHLFLAIKVFWFHLLIGLITGKVSSLSRKKNT